MKIISTQYLKGPNVWSVMHHGLVQVRLDTEKTTLPRELINFLHQQLYTLRLQHPEELLPSVSVNTANPQSDTPEFLAKFYIEVALALQHAAGSKGSFSDLRQTREPGVYRLVFACDTEEVGRYSAQAALQLMHIWLSGLEADLPQHLQELQQLKASYGLGPSTLSIVKAAEERGIPWLRLDRHSSVQL